MYGGRNGRESPTCCGEGRGPSRAPALAIDGRDGRAVDAHARERAGRIREDQAAVAVGAGSPRRCGDRARLGGAGARGGGPAARACGPRADRRSRLAGRAVPGVLPAVRGHGAGARPGPQRGEGRIVVVVDDVHRVEDEETAQLISTFVQNAPGNVHVVLSGRGTRAIPLARRRIAGWHSNWTPARSRSTRPRSGRSSARGVSGSPRGDQLRALPNRGWATGLQLMMLDAAGRRPCSPVRSAETPRSRGLLRRGGPRRPGRRAPVFPGGDGGRGDLHRRTRRSALGSRGRDGPDRPAAPPHRARGTRRRGPAPLPLSATAAGVPPRPAAGRRPRPRSSSTVGRRTGSPRDGSLSSPCGTRSAVGRRPARPASCGAVGCSSCWTAARTRCGR